MSEDELRNAYASEVVDVDAAFDGTDQELFACRNVSGDVRWFTRGQHGPGMGEWPLVGTGPGVPPESLGANSFLDAHGVRLAYVAGAMAGGIASADLVIAMGKSGLIGFFDLGSVHGVNSRFFPIC